MIISTLEEAVANQRENIIICIIMLTGQFHKHEGIIF